MEEITQHQAINEAIIRFMQTGCSQGVQDEIASVYGEAVARQVRSVYDAAVDCPVDWNKVNMNGALAALADFLRTEFPWLSAEAHTRLNYCYIMAWK